MTSETGFLPQLIIGYKHEAEQWHNYWFNQSIALIEHIMIFLEQILLHKNFYAFIKAYAENA